MPGIGQLEARDRRRLDAGSLTEGLLDLEPRQVVADEVDGLAGETRPVVDGERGELANVGDADKLELGRWCEADLEAGAEEGSGRVAGLREVVHKACGAENCPVDLAGGIGLDVLLNLGLAGEMRDRRRALTVPVDRRVDEVLDAVLDGRVKESLQAVERRLKRWYDLVRARTGTHLALRPLLGLLAAPGLLDRKDDVDLLAGKLFKDGLGRVEVALDNSDGFGQRLGRCRARVAREGKDGAGVLGSEEGFDDGAALLAGRAGDENRRGGHEMGGAG